MISDNELLTIVGGLLEKTSKERVPWQEEKRTGGIRQDGKEVPPGKIFQLRLPESVIELEHVRPPAEPDYITFALRRASDGQTVGGRRVYEGDFAWDQLFDLYALVSRQVMGWDGVLKDVKNFLERSTA